MGDEFYGLLKLTTGEEVLSIVCVDDNDGEPIIILQSPVIMKMMHTPHGQFMKVKSWLELADDSMFIIKNDKIITMTEINDPKVITIYQKFLNEEQSEIQNFDNTLEFNNQRGKVKVSENMGYISSVEQAREQFEKLFNSTNETSKES